MNSDLDYERDTQDTKPSTPTKEFSVGSLIKRVDEYQRRDHMETIETLTTDNSLLQHVIVKYQKNWCLTIEILEKTHQAVLTLQKALEHCIDEDIAAERQWLAFWGIKKECTTRQNYSPAGWI
ncbi:hypothetical protein B0J11DRAFT_449477 [Dendryphion nanum]|uniref:Uncharacterized protein n=1 Tax=Dendryphion nanum TaxID=256645 RepID=A0A9P9CXE8_9PLEO|nr:hypothetical protein B0J11DRAFT_449477 [Dendryphion nanum]